MNSETGPLVGARGSWTPTSEEGRGWDVKTEIWWARALSRTHSCTCEEG